MHRKAKLNPDLANETNAHAERGKRMYRISSRPVSNCLQRKLLLMRIRSLQSFILAVDVTASQPSLLLICCYFPNRVAYNPVVLDKTKRIRVQENSDRNFPESPHKAHAVREPFRTEAIWLLIASPQVALGEVHWSAQGCLLSLSLSRYTCIYVHLADEVKNEHTR